jgi:hypothetical protein
MTKPQTPGKLVFERDEITAIGALVFDTGWNADVDDDDFGCLPYIGTPGPVQRRLSDVDIAFQDRVAGTHIRNRIDLSCRIAMLLYRRLQQAEHVHLAVKDAARGRLAMLICDVRMLQSANRFQQLPTDVGFDCLEEAYAQLAAFACEIDLLDAEEMASLMTLKRECGHPWALSARLA